MVRYIKESIEDDFDEMFDFGDENAGWYASADIPKEYIKGATLLSKEEYERHRDDIPKLNLFWWLRSAGYLNFSACDVSFGGDVNYGCGVSNANHGIRPALILNLQSSNLNFDVGDKFEFGEHTFTILSNDLAICDDFVGKGRFRKDYEAEDANNYEKSDVKKVVDKWFDEAYRNYEG